MRLDDLIRTSLMVMAVARAGEQQSVIRCAHAFVKMVKTDFEEELQIARGLVQVQDMEGLGAHHISLFNITTIKKLIKVGAFTLID